MASFDDDIIWSTICQYVKEETEDDYRGEHSAPSRDDSPLHDVAPKTYPEDFYSSNGFRYYADYGEPHDRESYNKVARNRHKPDEKVWIHRAIPTSVYKQALEKAKTSGKSPLNHMIRRGDWVTISKQYAHEHGKSALNGDYKIASMRVPAKHVFTNGDSIHEWGYDPDE